MGKIHKLSPNLADMIAAGEVVERPASVIKELVENAVDAGATQITVEIQNGGITFMRVTDNGCGMSPEDAPTAFLRHATSKISTAEDLGSITTMGFRGEALAAISAVSKIDLLTKSEDGELGVSVRVEAGNVLEVSPAGCPQGTTIIVRELFYNTPARMKFLKRDSVEGSYIAGAVQRQALGHPEISFRFLRDGKPELTTPGDGKLLSAIYAAMGRQNAREMVEIQGIANGVTVRGYAGKPTANRGSRGYQHFFVNGRYVKSRMMTAALEEAYKNQMMVGRFPICVLHVDVAPAAVDVNVHPAKTEVKFLREKDVFDAIHFAVLGALSRTPDRPEMAIPKQSGSDFYKTMTAREFRETQGKSTLSSADRQTAREFLGTMAQRPARPAGNLPIRDSVRMVPGTNGPVTVQAGMPGPEEFVPVPETAAVTPEIPSEEADQVQTGLEMPPVPPPAAPEPEPVAAVTEKPEQAPYRIIGQTMDTYIIVEQGDTLLLFDKHAAHERILFEKFRAREHEIMSQVLLNPIPADLSSEDAALLMEQRPLLERLGFDIGEETGRLMIRAIPSDIDEKDAEACLSELAQDLSDGKTPDPDTVFDELLHTVACKAAIKGGRYTDTREIAALVAELMARDDIKYCPHGRPVCITLTRSNLERQFKRT